MSKEQFSHIINLIEEARSNAIQAVNIELINLYWQVGEYISYMVNHATWGDKKVEELASHIQINYPELKGFNKRSLYRMKQFFETYENDPIVSSLRTQLQISKNEAFPTTGKRISDIKTSLLTKLSWTHHLTIIARTKSAEERTYYLYQSIKENYSVKELDRQINSSLFERTMISKENLPTNMMKIEKDYNVTFRDNYIFEFLNLPNPYKESDLRDALVNQLKDFLLELGKDFIFMGKEYRLQVGNSDFYIDLLFFHRGLQCLIAFELKADKFKPEHLGQLNFYIEALDRDIKKPNENPSIGILLCKDKDNAVVEYALNRFLSPILVAEYQTQLPDKKRLEIVCERIFQHYEDNLLDNDLSENDTN